MNFKSKIKDKQGDIYGKESTIEVFVKKEVNHVKNQIEFFFSINWMQSHI